METQSPALYPDKRACSNRGGLSGLDEHLPKLSGSQVAHHEDAGHTHELPQQLRNDKVQSRPAFQYLPLRIHKPSLESQYPSWRARVSDAAVRGRMLWLHR